jgi:hypothetical protein
MISNDAILSHTQPSSTCELLIAHDPDGEVTSGLVRGHSKKHVVDDVASLGRRVQQRSKVYLLWPFVPAAVRPQVKLSGPSHAQRPASQERQPERTQGDSERSPGEDYRDRGRFGHLTTLTP